MLKQLHDEARKLLKDKKVNLIIGYEVSTDGISTTPCFIETEDEVERLVWNERCFYNLSRYLTELRDKRVAIVAKGCDVKSILGLVQEKQVKREDVVIMGMECEKQFKVEATHPAGTPKLKDNQGEPLEKCKSCQVHTPKLYDVLIKNPQPSTRDQGAPTAVYAQVEELEGKSVEERWKYWQAEFKKCIKCYACRQICPLCFCPECIADQNLPQWIVPSPSLPGNITWHIVRAYHLAGRCIDCGECERACPMKIPLRRINKKLEKEIRELFGYQAGQDSEVKLPLADFKLEDPQDFIK